MASGRYSRLSMLREWRILQVHFTQFGTVRTAVADHPGGNASLRVFLQLLRNTQHFAPYMLFIVNADYFTPLVEDRV